MWIAKSQDLFRGSLRDSRGIKPEFERCNFGVLKGGSYNQSVFLIEMGDHIFVEWSHSGACRIWKTGHPFLKVGRKRYHAKEFTSHLPDERITHNGAEDYKWQERLRRWIRDNTDIYIDHSKIRL
ncbi:MAG: EH signature domain-containing protein [Nitrospiria bacterium]